MKVDHPTINKYFDAFRTVCVSTVQEELINLGGNNKTVEVGVISLGTSGKNQVWVL